MCQFVLAGENGLDPEKWKAACIMGPSYLLLTVALCASLKVVAVLLLAHDTM